MPFVLILAFAASLAIHVAVLFGPQIELSADVEPQLLMADLKQVQRPPVEAAARPDPPPALAPRRKARRKVETVARASPVLSVPGSSPLAPVDPPAPSVPSVPMAEPAPPAEPPPAEPQLTEAPAASRLPPHGMIRYRVDRGDSNFEIGRARHEWSIVDGRYRLTSVVETTGLIWLVKSIRIEMESRGLIGVAGLVPQTFTIRRNGQPPRERASFDWAAMTVRVAEQADQPLDEGAQDLLSFNYQLGYLAHPEAGGNLPIATGKKYTIYRLEVLGDEVIDVPAGSMRTLHLRAPGSNTTELWLAYDYLLLPVKIRHVDAKGDSFVEVATTIQVGDELEGEQNRHDTAGDAADPR